MKTNPEQKETCVMALLEHVIQAIKFFKESNGSTLSDITSILKTNYGYLDDSRGNLKTKVQNALEHNIIDGVIMSRDGRYSVKITRSHISRCRSRRMSTEKGLERRID